MTSVAFHYVYRFWGRGASALQERKGNEAMNKTATQAAIERAEEERHESRMHRMHERFRERWAPGNNRHQFEADLAMLMQEVAAYSLKPFRDAAAVQISGPPMPPIILNKEGNGDD